MDFPSKRNYCVIAFAISLAPLSSQAQILAENFEDGVLDSRISVSSVGTFGLAPSIQLLTNFGSTRAFGFGMSTCGANCFNNFITLLQITFAAPTLVGSIKFNEMELYGNWGSTGHIALDGVALTGAALDFGRLPANDFIADSTYRSRSFEVNQAVSTITLGVVDITNQSQIAIDDLVITAVPELPVSALLTLGVVCLSLRSWARGKGLRHDA